MRRFPYYISHFFYSLCYITDDGMVVLVINKIGFVELIYIMHPITQQLNNKMYKHECLFRSIVRRVRYNRPVQVDFAGILSYA